MQPEGSRQRRAFANIPILSQTGILGPSIRRAPMSPSPSDPRAKGEKTDKGRKDKGKNKGKYILGRAHPPSFLLSFPASSPGGLLIVTMHLILVSQDRLCSLLLPQPLDRAGPRTPSLYLSTSPGLWRSRPAPREEMVTGLSLTALTTGTCRRRSHGPCR